MPGRNFKLGFTLRLLLITFVMTIFFRPDSFGRNGMKIYSVGTNSAWSLSSTWSASENGLSVGIVPQSDDTIIIKSSVVQNVDFTFSDHGVLSIESTGVLRGDNQILRFSGYSILECNGDIKINNLTFIENSSFLINVNGKILVKNSFINNSFGGPVISGKLSVTGTCLLGLAANIKGTGSIESAQFEGVGTAFGLSPTSLIPDGSLITEVNWVGSLNTNWNEPMNWSGKTVPGSNSNISILKSIYNPEITERAFSNNLYVNSGSSIIVHPNAVMDVQGNLTIIGVGKFLLKNTILAKSSLVLNGDVTGKIQSEYPVIKDQKYLISSPVEMAVSQTFLNMYLRTYDESSSQWGQYIVPTNDPLQVMQGYELFSIFSQTRIFEGTPAHEPQSYVISNSGNGLNLTGNPFTCFIDWENNANANWERNSIASAIYYPDPSGSGNFSVYLPGGDDAVSLNNGSRYIAPMQGFFVKAGSQGSLTVNTSSRVSNLSKSKLVLKNSSVKFRLSDNEGLKDEVLFRVLDNSTSNFDDQLDAVKISNNLESPSLYLESDDDVKYAINSIPSINSSLIIPLDIVSRKAGQYIISTVGASEFEFRYPVFLEDKELKTFTDLRVDSVYTFYHSPEMNSNRFVIHFIAPEVITEPNVDPTDVVVNPGEVLITGNENEIYTAVLFSAEGKLIGTSKGTLSEGISLSTGNKSIGVCVLKLSNGKQTITKKVFTK